MEAFTMATAMDRSVSFSTVAATALRQNDATVGKWVPASHTNAGCLQTIESSHPMSPLKGSAQMIRFPGAKSITISFDPQTAMSSNDVITFYKDETEDETWGEREGYRGIAAFPGLNGQPPMVIPADHVFVRVQPLRQVVSSVGSSQTAQYWGYRIVATAPVCQETADAIMGTLEASKLWA